MQIPSRQDWSFIVAAVVFGAVLSGLIGFAVWFNVRMQNLRLAEQVRSLSRLISPRPITPAPQPAPEIPATPSPSGSVEAKRDRLDIVWAEKPTLLNSREVDFYIRNSMPDDSIYTPVEKTETIVIGKINAQDYQYSGWSVLRAHAYDANDMMTFPVYREFALSSDQKRVVKMSDVLPALSETDFPLQLTLPNGKIVKRDNLGDELVEQTNCLECAARGESSTIIPLITSKEGIKLYRTAPIQGEYAYAFDRFGRGILYYDSLPENGLENIQWSVTNSSTVRYFAGPIFTSGCGGGPLTATAEQLGALKEVGTLSNGDKLYMPSDLNNNTLIKQRYDQWFPYFGEDDGDKPKPSFEEYLRLYPVPFFVRKNAFGAWVTYVSDRSGSMAECGKPVIYLYPEKETAVRVQLPKNIKVTISEPEYPAGGWEVVAKPSGELSNASGQAFSSLFWEGTGVDYPAPEEGFVVKQDNVVSFLSVTVPKYGLNPRETAEFMDFWVPKFKGSPYYRISFLTTAWDQAAPLKVTPAPQTLIRLFMDWSPLREPILLPEPIVKTTKRSGFTLVEWGGLLRK